MGIMGGKRPKRQVLKMLYSWRKDPSKAALKKALKAAIGFRNAA